MTDDRTPPGPELVAWQGDICTAETDAIVNAANSRLRPGSGVCGAIYAAAGLERLRAATDMIGGCPVGDARATDGFGLTDGSRRRWIVHAVGPDVRDGMRPGAEEELAAAYRRSVEVADGLGATSIAFPSISTGVYGFDPDLATVTAVAALRALRPDHVRRVELVAFDEAQLRRYERALADD